MRLHRPGLFLLLLIFGGTIGISVWFTWNARHNSDVPFLAHDRPAEWIVYPSPFSAAERTRIELETRFHREFLLERVPAKAQLSWRGFRRCTIQINHVELVLPPDDGTLNWKQTRSEEIAQILRPGTNHIEATVFNESGPPALWLTLQGGALDIRSDASWDSSFAGASWHRARLADEPGKIMSGSPIYGGEQAGRSFIARWRHLLLFALIAGCLLGSGRWALQRMKASPQTFGSGIWTDPAAACLAGLILCWIVLLIHNADLLPRIIGFDAQHHLDYIDYIQQRGRLPLANEGATMYNPPLYYLTGALVLSTFGLKTADLAGVVVLRYWGMVIGIAHLLLVFGSLRLLFPNQKSRQVIGLLLAGLAPAQLYLSHYVTNEVLAGVLVTATLYTCLRALQDQTPSLARYAGVGAVMGLALLTKFTAILVVPVVFAAIAFRSFQKDPRQSRPLLQAASVTLVTCLAVCGWHYGRVWLHFGKPFYGNWEASSGHFGWQDPGYRTATYFLRFGESLSSPLFSGQASLADAIYSTGWGDGYCGGISGLVMRSPWNYELMAAGFLLALLPTALIAVGAVISLKNLIQKPTTEGVLLNGLAWAFVAALLQMALKFPTYALVKAFYGLLTLLPVCTFGAIGWDFLAHRKKLLWGALSTALGVWALCVYSSYWILGNSAQRYLLQGLDLVLDNKLEPAVERLSAALAAAPTNVLASSLLIDSLDRLGRKTAAERLRNELRQKHPEAPECQLELALSLEKEGRLAESVDHTRQAIAAAPEDEQGYRQLAGRLGKLGEVPQSITACREGLRIAPADSELHFLLGMALLNQVPSSNSPAGAISVEDPRNSNAPADTEEGIRHLRVACELAENFWQAFNGLAWVLATHPNARWRNGSEAVQFAEHACQLTTYRQPAVLGTLAVAYAEVGRFPEAINMVQRAQGLLRQLGKTEPLPLHEEWLRLFNAGQPYRAAQKLSTK